MSEEIPKKMKLNEPEPKYESWHSIIENNAKNLGHKIFIESLDQNKKISFHKMNEYCNKVANFLKSQKLLKSDKVALIGKNSIENMIIYFGVLKYGAILLPIFSEESQDNLHRILRLAQIKLVLYDSDLNLDKKNGPPVQWISFSEFFENDSAECEFSEHLKDQSVTFNDHLGDRNDIAEIVYTSGTTELPKGIFISRDVLFYMVEEISKRTGITEKDCVLEYRAYNWLSSQLLTILTSMMKGNSLFFGKKFSLSNFPNWLKENNITVSSGVPAVLSMMVNKPVSLCKEDVPNLRFITSSSAPLPMETQLKFEEMYGIPIVQGMGMSEAGWMLFNPPERKKRGSVGLPLKYKEVFFVKNNGLRCEPGEIGEMRIKGKTMGLSYLNGDGSIEEFSKEGFATGDLGFMDEEGYIYIKGRKKELIIRGGINISPLEITACLLTHPEISEAATIGIPDKIYGEEVFSFVVLKNGSKADEADIIAYCKTTLPDFKIPKNILFIPEIPKTQRGKIAKKDLLKLFEEYMN
ncbi:class I adenylate-forming enzyme family protein [Desulfobacula toluolica]|uniref:LcfB2: long-chain-fatty-acid--CoA ligase n=1 Tax=Desulfobacula toluolica (strain DSM 7467 / Tol2) TaxID=651182 RepID=K0NHT7_DESTT|nr:class I adenylate-forming enzyme family protein [Desulfobacula toluolica]CCK80849.1 LcfB: long-chain-fatty-acid--CoA ligase [Desulfobacula toluolica Tol2]CCK80868.1 LcfB2: long-chain-fatty-acid--CoA ligase [Desulfobacula toluolica Tol2]CCK80885.1 LcfB3: long-chain-fatty-acid--CoA ligase [Desulfobacula toluolica Tol2]CCK80906.1 LcfB4: long-chain-fatty-acid--CoA ligase [Desulfobacula toluolica Tol2]CCK80925.1 LcfB5: long-chain-fatty-acid--CoA ligase [Desulfobacula toluolica Tol2]